MLRIASIAASVLAAFIIAGTVMACSGQTQPAQTAGATSAPKPMYSVLANGKSIFDTGRDFNGAQIQAQMKPLATSCEACHRADGSGGKKFADGAVSADLRHKALVLQQTHPYTIALLERAISTGIDDEGKPLDKVMPHWKMSKRDLHDVAQYVMRELK